jgi:hypothetical protein
VAFLLGVLLALARQAAAAPEVFTASGRFEDGSLSGTLTIDTATGKPLSSDLIVSGSSYGELTFIGVPVTSVVQTDSTRMRIQGSNAKGEQFTLQLQLRVSTLVGYDGGPIEPGVKVPNSSYWTPDFFPGGSVYINTDENLESGFLEPAGSPNPP